MDQVRAASSLVLEQVPEVEVRDQPPVLDDVSFFRRGRRCGISSDCAIGTCYQCIPPFFDRDETCAQVPRGSFILGRDNDSHDPLFLAIFLRCPGALRGLDKLDLLFPLVDKLGRKGGRPGPESRRECAALLRPADFDA